MRTRALLFAFTTLGCDAVAQQRERSERERPDRERLPACEWCGASEAPALAGLTATMTIAGPEEPGVRLTVRGTVYRPDGSTPAAGVLLYAYHTNAAGVYPTRGDERGNAQRHGYLRNWLLTDSAGRYTIHTIRPAAYPSRTEPAHIHITLAPPGEREQWVDGGVWFADDPLLPPAARRRDWEVASIVTPVRSVDGSLTVTRDLVLDATGSRSRNGDDFVLPRGTRPGAPASGASPTGAPAAGDLTLAVDPAASRLLWKGTKFWGRGSHSGTVQLGAGSLTVRDDHLRAATVTIDMRTIQVTDIPESDPIPRRRLTDHLRSEPFFWVDRHPAATLVITSATPDSARHYTVDGRLTLRGVSRPLRFPATLERFDAAALVATARIVINRHDWGVSFRGTLARDLVDDDITLDVTLVARPRA